MPTAPSISYIVWHTQRTGSTLLCTTLEATGVAGHPDEWPDSELTSTTDSAQSTRERLWSEQATPNGVLGVKWSFHQSSIDGFFLKLSEGRSRTEAVKEIWASVFPNCRHIVMTRRDKVRLAVSWWKAINGGPGHLSRDGGALPWQDAIPKAPVDLEDAYNFDAIKNLILEVVQREAGLQRLLAELGVRPLSVTYEDFVSDYELTVRGVLDFLELDQSVAEIPRPLLRETSDDVNEQWVGQFLTDLNLPSR